MTDGTSSQVGVGGEVQYAATHSHSRKCFKTGATEAKVSFVSRIGLDC